jgi:hypothetical protein
MMPRAARHAGMDIAASAIQCSTSKFEGLMTVAMRKLM